MIALLILSALALTARGFMHSGLQRWNRLSIQLSSHENVPTSFREQAISKLLTVQKSVLQTSIATSASFATLLSNNQNLARAAEITPTEVAPIVVLGGNGKTARLIIDILAKQGIPVRPTRRTLDSKVSMVYAENVLTPMAADVTKVETLENAIKDARCVIFAASASSKGGNAQQVDYLGVENVAKECIRLQIPRLIVISSGAVTKPNSFGYKFTNIFGSIMDYKIKGENSVRALYESANNPSISYAIIRPGGLLDGNAVSARNIELNQGDTIIGEINRSDLAECVAAAAVSSVLPKDVTFEVYNRNKRNPLEGRFSSTSGYERLGETYDEMFQRLTPGYIKIN